ncbi:ubiquitin-related domain-containing protein [Pavlovales sp. CCMP2436]|nr:ubiquitin-related domain-containing protein [Pavlovales sp. CCMP2436]
MSTNETGTKPTGEGGAETINIRCKMNADNNEILFKCKMTTQLSKLMNAFCQRQGVTMQSVRFLFDSEQIALGQTPRDLEMADGDLIDVFVEQTGGMRFGNSTT